ncbi:UTP--glucose-1-phosphate uridylyltransferase GalU [Defluviimonas salinarum]|uniref:UTP--glucose-1-phosphate uridylyltransferase n=1 Tax=Defluviimonas salinarum TaxID=2992147 RepID=A0ABT3J5H7_9RHOB|nr:UTP--glucose-1-phosphate uridylyltransferase GalU [Defluviimonas salinarum]MCW3782941.1 UTP--glucose-1-phosphate uridylyltransferase GalU [Defluviimonas salinarum]
MPPPPVRKAVFPVAGLGTRFLPATKSVPKEILTLVDRPLIQYAIDEAREAGITEFIFVTSRGKSALEDYFDLAPEIERKLMKAGKQDLLHQLRATNMPSGAIAYVRQNQPLGLGHAISCARHLIGDEPFAVILPDDVIAAQTPCLKQMVDAHAKTGGNMMAVMDVPKSRISSYGVIDPASEDGDIILARGLVEKPTTEAAPSTLAVIGRYILTPAILSNLDRAERGAGGEIQLTDAIAKEAVEAGNVRGFRFDGIRFDCGSKIGFLQATVAFGLSRPDLAPDFAPFLAGVTGMSIAAE